MIPEKIGRYEIKAELGRGGMATVYRANDPRFEREVAVKVLPREMLHDPQFRTRFEREAKTIALLEHPAIVPVYDFGEEDGQPYFVMRFMTGGSLSDRLKNGPISVKEAARLFARLAPALDSAHAKGIIHRDLKPGNILFDQYGEPYVSDFGIAKLTEAQASVTGSAIVGTPAYMSPEQAQGEGVDGRSDIYGMGVILFEALTGQQPFQGDTPMSVVVKHITDPVPHILDLKPDLPTGAEKIVEKALAKDKKERFATCQQMADALSAVSRGETPDLGPAPTASRMAAPKTQTSKKTAVQAKTVLAKREQAADPQPPRKRTGLWVGLGISAFVLCAVVVAGVFLFRDQIPLFAQKTPTLEFVGRTPSIEISQPTDTKTAGVTENPHVIPTDTFISTSAPTNTPGVPAVGGVDLIAFINANNIWLMGTDGSDLRQVTTDGAVKHSLQWSPDGESVFYISGKCIWSVNILNNEAKSLTCFNAAQYLEDLAISRDGTQIAISLDRTLYVVPFDLAALGAARNHTDMNGMKGCFTYNGLGVKAVRWSGDGKQIAVKVVAPAAGLHVDRVLVFDISACDSSAVATVAAFPGPSFVMTGYAERPYIPSYDWDGGSLFLLNSDYRNDSYGYLYLYNIEARRFEELDPLNTNCCYSDALWSPDGTYVFFAHQDFNLGSASKNYLYYVPFGAAQAGASIDPIPLPEDFLFKPRDHPEAALRPVK
jgi:serine/threonine-protein kinase